MEIKGKYINYSSKELSAKTIKIFEGLGLTAAHEVSHYNLPWIVCIDNLTSRGNLSSLHRINYHPLNTLVLFNPKIDNSIYTSGIYAKFRNVVSWTNDSELENILNICHRRWLQISEVLNTDFVKTKLIGNSSSWKRLLYEVIETALFTDQAMLFIGETGTGKENLARLVHLIDKKHNKNEIVLLDCTTIMPELWGSEFFGHEKGAYTGSIYERTGAFELAHESTLFLDEVGELSAVMQSALLRVLEDGIFKKTGSNYYQYTEFRLICATNKNLLSKVKRKRFRSDLYYRIAGCVFMVPTLKDRFEDIRIFVDHFRNEYFSKTEPAICEPVYSLLLSLEYPGNIRELKHLVERICGRYQGYGPINLSHVPNQKSNNTTKKKSEDNDYFELMTMKAISEGLDLHLIKERSAAAAIKKALQITNGKVKDAASLLNISDRTIQLNMKKNKSPN